MSGMGRTAAQHNDASNCAAALRALVSGGLRDWRGISPGCSRADAEAALGPSESGPDGSGLLGNMPAAFRDYPPRPAAPQGITVWYADDQVIAVQIHAPVLAEPLEQMLGPAEDTEPSRLKSFHSQWIYASRGLTAHVDNMTHAVLRLYAYAPMTVAEFLDSELSRVESRRIPLRR